MLYIAFNTEKKKKHKFIVFVRCNYFSELLNSKKIKLTVLILIILNEKNFFTFGLDQLKHIKMFRENEHFFPCFFYSFNLH